MTPAAVGDDLVEGRGLMRWVVPASLLLHVVVVAWLPSTARAVASAPPSPVVLEIAAAPPPSPPDPPAPAPEPATASRSFETRPIAAPARAEARRDVVASAPAGVTAPADFTGTVLTNDGDGVALGGGGGARSAGVAVRAPSIAPTSERVVDVASLARRPEAPGLDAELERQYPPAARRSGIAGRATLRVRISADGRVGAVHVVEESWAGFGPACERTVRAGRWAPPVDRDGAAVATEITYTCRFEVRS